MPGHGRHTCSSATERRAEFPAHLQGAFGSRRYAPLDPPDLLNYEGCELLLIAASDDVEDELGLQLEDGEGENQQAAASCSDLVATTPTILFIEILYLQ